MNVRARFSQGKFGFYGGQRRYDGDEFTLADAKHFSEKWMVKLDDDKPKRGRKTAVEQAEAGEGAE